MTRVEPLRIKHHSLTGRITLSVMHDAFRAVKRNKGKAGVDRVSIELYAQQLDQNLIALMRDLKEGTFQPRPVLRRYIEKGGANCVRWGFPPFATGLPRKCSADSSVHCSNPCFMTTHTASGPVDLATRRWSGCSKLGEAAIGMCWMPTSPGGSECD